ncbi:hypothetical protein C3747_9g270 [Trypanosoma cruzi]|uniref:Uncharacterized protein n=2 Tax=Trypanosoma cruzi TaxID=5693 RepID=Q4D862_TRYCC|nr:hypothetical protein, conserved [Trypanosoma cruzi]EAN88721.1 hypothetical protein, conserved [Trypanosoma cruzi]PWV19662.1 hypothetical protein C3747_9g270 [Trypanosoma cruzi]RNC48674.1 glycoprotein 96-92 [Trypanosoma cruzi]|eukprot:XP_810572.1 hypothetical protein [Trypanosoma cruzi strain CL Brener]
MLDGETLPSVGQSQVGNAGLSPEQRKYHVISAQLESIMGEACKEPPSGANFVSIKRRITALQYALEEAERRICEKQRLDDISRKRRVLDVYLRRAKKDEERRDVLEKDDGRRKQLVSEMQEEKRFYYNQKNKEVGGRIEKYKNSIFDAQAAVIERAEAEGEKRNRILSRLQEERARTAYEHKEKSRKRMERCREVLNRRKQQEEERRREKQAAFISHMRKLEQDEGIDAILNKRKDIHSFLARRRNSSRAGTDDGFMEAAAPSRYKTHETLLRELKEKEEQHKARYEAEQAFRQYEIQLRAHARQKRMERQRQNYRAQLEKRIQRNDEIIEMAREKKKRGELVKDAREAREQENLNEITRDIEQHRNRAEKMAYRRHQDALEKNYYRWNGRAQRVILQLQDAIRADKDKNCAMDENEVFMPTALCSFDNL